MVSYRKTAAALGKTLVTPLLLACLCAACASAPPKREDGIFGLVYDTVSKSRKAKAARQEAARLERDDDNHEPAEAEPAAAKRAARQQDGKTPPSRYPSTDYEYCLQPGDRIKVSFFKKPSYDKSSEYLVDKLDKLHVSVAGPKPFAEDVTVRIDGHITFRIIGDVDVAGKTVADIRKDVRARLVETIPAAEVSVSLRQGHGLARAFMDGVLRPNEKSWSSITVRPDGIVSFPVVGEVNVVGMPLSRVSRIVQERYDETFNEGISVSLGLVLERRNTAILGEVRRPGLYALYQSVHPLSALAMAGGELRDTARLSKVVLLKKQADGSFDRRFLDLTISAAARRSGYTDVLVEPQDILLVPRTGIANVNRWVDQYIRRLLPLPTYGSVHHTID